MDDLKLSEFEGVYECPECGFNYVPSLPEDRAAHELHHRFILEPRLPIPFKLKSHSKQSKHLLWPTKKDHCTIKTHMRQYAVSFRREMRTDFIQWSIDEFSDRDVRPFLIVDENHFVGGGVFRQHNTLEPWSLAWIWICRSKRREGLLRKIWPTFTIDTPELENFSVEDPVSADMKSFLVSIDYLNASSLYEFPLREKHR